MTTKNRVALVLFVMMTMLSVLTSISFVWIYFSSGVLAFLVSSVFTSRGFRFKTSEWSLSHFLTCFFFGLVGLFLIGITSPTNRGIVR